MISTERLVLRPYEARDCDAYLAMSNDPAVARFPPGKPMSAEDAWSRVMRYAGHWGLLGYGMFAVIEGASGRYLGETGLSDFRRGMGPDFDGFDEASWYFSAAAQGRGYAAEAAVAAHAWYDGNAGARRTVCMIDPGHERSIQLAHKLGYRFLRRAEYRANQVALFERPAAGVMGPDGLPPR